MFSFLNLLKKPFTYISFEEIQDAIKNPREYSIINTMDIDNREHKCLISGTIEPNREEELVNEWISNYEFHKHKIIIYGMNSHDTTVEKKAEQLASIGFSQLYIYRGGFFEWILLQDIYGSELFPTTSKVRDILYYK